MSEIRGATVTLLFADIAGSTRLLAELGPEYTGLLADYRRLVAAAAEPEHGSLIDTAGDGLFYAFPTARGALIAALGTQRAMREHAWPGGALVEARIGIHTGSRSRPRPAWSGSTSTVRPGSAPPGTGARSCFPSRPTSSSGRSPTRDDLPRPREHRLKDLERLERVFQATTADMPAEFPPIRSLDNWPNNLPRQLSTFVGRNRRSPP